MRQFIAFCIFVMADESSGTTSSLLSSWMRNGVENVKLLEATELFNTFI